MKENWTTPSSRVSPYGLISISAPLARPGPSCRDLAGEVTYKPGGKIERRANDQLQKAAEQLEHVQSIGLFKALEDGEFADVKRDPRGGRGFEGVFRITPDYFNPFFAALRDGRMSGAPEGPAPGSSAPAKDGGH